MTGKKVPIGLQLFSVRGECAKDLPATLIKVAEIGYVAAEPWGYGGNKLEWMGQNAELLRHRALQGEEWSGCFKYRVGDYRIIYQIDWSVERLIVLKVGHRREVYG